jgi:hypothetical protein
VSRRGPARDRGRARDRAWWPPPEPPQRASREATTDARAAGGNVPVAGSRTPRRAPPGVGAGTPAPAAGVSGPPTGRAGPWRRERQPGLGDTRATRARAALDPGHHATAELDPALGPVCPSCRQQHQGPSPRDPLARLIGPPAPTDPRIRGAAPPGWGRG